LRQQLMPYHYSKDGCIKIIIDVGQSESIPQPSSEGNGVSLGYAVIAGIVVCLATICRRNIVSNLSQMDGEFILMSAGASLFDPKRKITSSIVNEFSLIILRRSNFGVCNSSILLERSSSIRLNLMGISKKLVAM